MIRSRCRAATPELRPASAAPADRPCPLAEAMADGGAARRNSSSSAARRRPKSARMPAWTRTTGEIRRCARLSRLSSPSMLRDSTASLDKLEAGRIGEGTVPAGVEVGALDKLLVRDEVLVQAPQRRNRVDQEVPVRPVLRERVAAQAQPREAGQLGQRPARLEGGELVVVQVKDLELAELGKLLRARQRGERVGREVELHQPAAAQHRRRHTRE
eukprot:scaffold4747_cov99-Isochrysis_galbana.AAC.3